MKNLLLILILCLYPIAFFAQYSIFEQAKKHYSQPKDSLKQQAVEFIEKNINEHYSIFVRYQNSAGKKVHFNELTYANFNESQQALKKINLIAKEEKKSDISQLAYTDLIEIIERGFAVWGKSWNKNLSFDDFCNYLLPYKVENEPFENWYSKFEQKFSHLQKGKNPQEIVNIVNTDLQKWFFSSWSFEKRELSYSLSPSQLLFRKQGYCLDWCHLSAYVMRLNGVAVCVDFTPAWATSSYDHAWCAYIDENNKFKPFEGVKGKSNDFVIFREPSKVFRVAYAKQAKALASILPQNEIPTKHLKRKNIIDVTDSYWRTTDVNCSLTNVSKNKVAYVSVFNALKWKIVGWGKVTNNKAFFDRLPVGVVFLPQNYENGKTNIAGVPFLIRADKSVTQLKPNYNKKIKVTIAEAAKYLYYRTGKKYTFYYWDKGWKSIGTKTATEDKVLTFENVPSNTIYILIPEYSEKKERIFTINENGEIERW
ncbi:MAG: transglutaminase-like domain-containing protein [Bacteroidales bacterium]|jgi:hypothetical protein|nr:transglutaminase-like domain-containing protein [Bacteroidales bacterium]